MRYRTMRPGTKRRLRLTCRIVIAGVLVGIAYGSLLHVLAYGRTLAEVLTGALIGAIHGFLISATIGPLHIFGFRTRLGGAVDRAPFLVSLVVQTLIYGAIVAFVNVVEPGTRMLGFTPARGPRQIVAVIFSVLATLAFIFVVQISQILGGHTLRDWVLGRYHRPRREDRFFLFVDIVGSTALAERLGPARVHQFLNRVFVLASDPIDDHRGEVYQYVGDEMVITWTEAEGRLGARPMQCFTAIEAALAAVGPEFTREFGIAPRVRGALHVGPVIVGEVGGSKRDIVFHGDVMNTTSRLEQVGRDLDRRLVISADAMSRFGGSGAFASFEDLGARVVRGRTAPVQMYAAPSGVAGSGPREPVNASRAGGKRLPTGG